MMLFVLLVLADMSLLIPSNIPQATPPGAIAFTAFWAGLWAPAEG